MLIDVRAFPGVRCENVNLALLQQRSIIMEAGDAANIAHASDHDNDAGVLLKAVQMSRHAKYECATQKATSSPTNICTGKGTVHVLSRQKR